VSVDSNDRVRLGARLRHARESSRLSLGEVAERAGVTKSFLSRVERDITSPSIASLLEICDAVGMAPADLFQVPRTTLVRRADRPQIRELPKSDEVVDTLITPADERHVTVLETVATGRSSGGDVLYTLPSQCEVCFVVEGTVEVQVEDRAFLLRRGDALTFGAAVPHTWRATTTAGARVLWILAPGLPDPRSAAT
jgi:transcriptional regulator with XRE-family HTH domain